MDVEDRFSKRSTLAQIIILVLQQTAGTLSGCLKNITLFLQTGCAFLVLWNDRCQEIILFPYVFMPECNKALHVVKAFQSALA